MDPAAERAVVFACRMAIDAARSIPVEPSPGENRRSGYHGGSCVGPDGGHAVSPAFEAGASGRDQVGEGGSIVEAQP